MQLSAYDLEQALAKKFTVSMESEQEIEIQAEEVIINSDATVDGDIEELAEDVGVVEETSENLVQVEEATETLESLIATMESRLLTGGFDKTNAQLANISLESITARFGLESTILSFGMEAVEDDAEGETKSTIDKAKQMLGALKSNSGALLNKMYSAAASALGNVAAISAKLIAKAGSLKSNISADNKGGNPVKLSRGVKRKLTVDGKTALDPNTYVKELKRLTDKYNSVVKVYADTSMLEGFVSDIVKGMNGQQGEPASRQAIISSVKTISEGITNSAKAPEGVDAAISAPYLGGAVIALKRPTTKSIEALLSESVKKQQVSQEGIGAFIKADIQQAFGSMLFCLGVGGIVLTGFAALVTLTGGLSVLGLGVGALTTAVLGIVSTKGLKQGALMYASGVATKSEEIAGLAGAVRDKLSKKSTEIATVATSFEMDTTDIAMESDEEATVNSLSAQQIAQVATIVQNTSVTTQTMRAELNKRKAVMKNIDQLTKTLAAENKDANNALTKASSTFVKQFIKQTIKFEMDLTSYSVGVMKAALAYAELSNGSTAAEPEAAAV